MYETFISYIFYIHLIYNILANVILYSLFYLISAIVKSLQ